MTWFQAYAFAMPFVGAALAAGFGWLLVRQDEQALQRVAKRRFAAE